MTKREPERGMEQQKDRLRIDRGTDIFCRTGKIRFCTKGETECSLNFPFSQLASNECVCDALFDNVLWLILARLF